jgi:hypothetical protein
MEMTMNKFGVAIASLLLIASWAAPASAQEVIEDPGWCAQFYPNANCQNYGPGNPYRGPYSYQQQREYRERGMTTGRAHSWGTGGQVNRGARGNRVYP